MDPLASLTPIFGHVAGIPVEEMLPGVFAIGVLGSRVAAELVRRRLGWRADGDQDPGGGLRGRSR